MVALLSFTFYLLTFNHASAATRVEELQTSISSKQTEIETLQKEIKELDSKVKATSQTAKTLSDAVKQLEASSKKITADISLTEKKIDLTKLTIERLAGEIGTKSGEITKNNRGLGEVLRRLNEQEEFSVIEGALGGDDLSTFWSRVEELKQLQGSVNIKVSDLKEKKAGLESTKSENEELEKKLTSLRVSLSEQKKVADSNKTQQTKLLAETKNKESGYKQLLAEKKAREEQFEKELANIEAKLKYELDPLALPKAGSSALSWPLDSVLITQYFGNTSFSQSALGAVYNGKGHNGIDFRASFGTPIKAARGGTVLGTGDTDLTCPNASYGRWVFIRHENGLSTLYAHLSIISVTEGSQVGTGSVIGYSGNTGYSTGPHLHFSVAASAGSQIGNLKSKNAACGTYRLPIAALNAYLNPLDYLPR